VPDTVRFSMSVDRVEVGLRLDAGHTFIRLVQAAGERRPQISTDRTKNKNAALRRGHQCQCQLPLPNREASICCQPDQLGLSGTQGARSPGKRSGGAWNYFQPIQAVDHARVIWSEALDGGFRRKLTTALIMAKPIMELPQT